MSQVTSAKLASRLSAILLILFWIHLAALFFVNQWGSFFGHWIAALFVLVGFTGTVKRHTGMLLFYFIVQLFFLILIPIGLIAIFVIGLALLAANDHGYINPKQEPLQSQLSSIEGPHQYGIIGLIVGIVVLILEIWSTVLAYKLRKQIFLERTEQEMETVVSNDAVVPEVTTPGEIEMKPTQGFNIQDGQVPVPFYPYAYSPVLVQPELNGQQTPVYFYPVPYPVQQY